MTRLNSACSFSWIGTSCMLPQDAERELASLREQPMLDKDLLKKTASTARGVRRESGGEKLPWQPSLPSSVTGPAQDYPASSQGFTTAQVIKKYQEEARAFSEALASTPNYRHAQNYMKSLGELETLLWKAFAVERLAAANAETRKMKVAQDIERASVEAELKKREDRLRVGCRRKADALRREHQVRLEASHADVQGVHQHAPLAEGLVPATKPAYSGGGQYLQDSARLVAVIKEHEVEARQDAEVGARYSLNHPEKETLFRKQLQAEAIQREKHNRLLRAHERSRVERMRLIFARNHHALGRLSERRRVENRHRKEKLIKHLAVAKGEVTRACRKHIHPNGIKLKGWAKQEWVEKVKTSAEPFNVGANLTPEQVAMVTQCGLQEKDAMATRASMVEREEVKHTMIPSELDTKSNNIQSSALSPLGQQQVVCSQDTGQDFYIDQKVGCEDAGSGILCGKVPLSSTDCNVRRVGGCAPAAASNVAKPIALDSLADNVIQGRSRLQNVEELVDNVAGVDFVNISLHRDEAHEQLQASVVDVIAVGSAVKNASSVASCACRATEKGQTGVTWHRGSGACTAVDAPDGKPSDAINGNTRVRYPKNSSKRVTRKRGGAFSKERRQRPGTATASVLPTSSGVLGGVLSALSEAESNALVSLGKNAPNDPRELLTSPAQSLERAQLLLDLGDVAGKNGSAAIGVFEDGRHSQERALDRAVDKLVSQMREEENLTRQRLGIDPLIL